MPRLKVSHITTYTYRRPVRFNPHRLMLRTLGGPDLQLVSHEVDCSPHADITWSQDVFGNLVAVAEFADAADVLQIRSRLVVESAAEAWPVFRIEPHAQNHPFRYSDDDLLDLGAMRNASTVDPAVVRWAAGFVMREGVDTLSLLKDLNAGVRGHVTYVTRDEHGTQAGAVTLARGSGSCRDMAALFIEAARSLGFGARAVSGYLIDPQAPQSESDTTHAWAEVYVPGAGWIPFDPTHQSMGAAGLLPVAVGRTNEQILPITGGYVGAPEDWRDLTVRVEIRADD